MSRDIFNRLFQRCEQLGQPLTNADGIRYIKKLSSDDADLMSSADCVTISLTKTIRFVKLTFGGEIYYCLYGIAEPEEMPNGFRLTDLTPGLFSASLLDSGLKPCATVSEIRDAVEGVFKKENEEYHGHDLESITGLFPPCKSYVVEGDNIYSTDAERVLGTFLCKSYNDGPLEYEVETLNALIEFFENGPDYVPYYNVVQGVLSIYWESLFLELYRCIEQLYAQPRISELKGGCQLSNSTHSLRELAEILEEKLSWRPKEEEAIKQLFGGIEESFILRLGIALGIVEVNDNGDVIIDGNAAKNYVSSVASKVYKLRNSIVHYRPKHEKHSYTLEQWNNITRSMLGVVGQLYQSHGKDFF
ncbi:hypothetical protein [Serratia quinivorans]|uniref:hypothetical protein n=1 Tax=Serratia quinivorans TaxID=137545 RepID=UPI000F82AEFE|nr:hypothetical protein [Serratia quinivorans]